MHIELPALPPPSPPTHTPPLPSMQFLNRSVASYDLSNATNRDSSPRAYGNEFLKGLTTLTVCSFQSLSAKDIHKTKTILPPSPNTRSSPFPAEKKHEAVLPQRQPMSKRSEITRSREEKYDRAQSGTGKWCDVTRHKVESWLQLQS